MNSLGLGDVSAGLHTLTFQGLATADETAFLDNISIATVPEPSTWTAMLLGFGGLSAAMLLRKKRVASNSPVDWRQRLFSPSLQRYHNTAMLKPAVSVAVPAFRG